MEAGYIRTIHCINAEWDDVRARVRPAVRVVVGARVPANWARRQWRRVRRLLLFIQVNGKLFLTMVYVFEQGSWNTAFCFPTNGYVCTNVPAEHALHGHQSLLVKKLTTTRRMVREQWHRLAYQSLNFRFNTFMFHNDKIFFKWEVVFLLIAKQIWWLRQS
jgi:hypothetical protein